MRASARPRRRAGRSRHQRDRVRAFGLNRSELYTRQGHSPSVRFPRVLGIECVGVVDDAGATDLAVGQTVAALMGEIGTSSVGMAAASLAKERGLRVLATTRDAAKADTTSAERSTAALQEIVDGVAAGRYPPNVERVFRLDEIVAAHRFMEENRGTGKLVVTVAR